jgi:glycosyltransferase involved in cell wall biosynthesis
MTHSVLLLSRYERLGASSRVRHYNCVPGLEQAGFKVTVAPLLENDYLERLYSGASESPPAMLKNYWRRLRHLFTARRYDLIWIEKEALPWLPASVERAFFRGRPLVIDFDDAWYLRYASHPNRLVRVILGRKLDTLLADASVVTTGSPELTKWATASGAAHVVQMPSSVDIDRYPVLPLPEGPFTIGWMGTPSNVSYLKLIAEPLRHLQRVYGARVRVMGGDQFSIPGVSFDHIPWREDTEARELAACHVGVAPLLDGPWERGKCGYKLLQYMAAARPCVASPVGPNPSIIVPGKTGFLADRPEEWISALTGLAADRERARTLGLAARQRAEAMYSLQDYAAKLISVLKSALRERATDYATATPVRESASTTHSFFP